MSSYRPKILVVLTSHAPGWYLPEFAHPFEVLNTSCDIIVASHKGGDAPVDVSSISAFKDDEISSKFLEEHKALWKNTFKLEDLIGKSKDFDVIFYVGGYGPMFDLVSSDASKAVIGDFYTNNKLLSAICHGSAAFVHMKVPGTETDLLAGHRTTGISNLEIEMLSSSGIIEPFSVEDELQKATSGAYEKSDPFTGKVVVSKGQDGRTIITGQNPASGLELGKAIYEELFQVPYDG